MPGKKARKRAPPNPTRAPAELEVECVPQLRKIEDKHNSLGSVAEVTPMEMPGKKGWKSQQLTPATPASAPTEVEVECGTQLRRFGDKVNFRQKLLNLISKLFSLVT